MKTRSFLFLSTLAALAGLLGTTSTARSQTVISSLPYTITTGGLYVLNGNLSSAQTGGNLITINASNVTIDFQDHFISGPSSGGVPANGIYAIERANIVIKNGTISHCNYGLYFESSTNNNATTNAVNARVDTMRVAHCLEDGICLNHQPSARITNCQVSQIGTSTSTRYTAGIETIGPEVTVQGCSVSDITAGSGINAYCIFADNGVFVRQNQLSNGTDAVRFGIYQDNLCYQCTNLFTGGTDGGGNTSSN